MVFYRESRSSELESRRRRNATTRAPIMTMITAIDSHRAFDPNGDDDVEDDESVSWEVPSLAFAEGTEEPPDSSVFPSDSPADADCAADSPSSESPEYVKEIDPRVECPSELVIWNPTTYMPGEASTSSRTVNEITFPEIVGVPLAMTFPDDLFDTAMVLKLSLGLPDIVS